MQPVTVLASSVSVPPLKMPPPSNELPCSMVTPEMDTVAPVFTMMTPTPFPPLIARSEAPGPATVTLGPNVNGLKTVMTADQVAVHCAGNRLPQRAGAAVARICNRPNVCESR